MIRIGAMLFAAVLVTGCKAAPEAPEEVPQQVTDDSELKDKAKSIEAAADEAAKLIEEDAKTEIEAAKADAEQQN